MTTRQVNFFYVITKYSVSELVTKIETKLNGVRLSSLGRRRRSRLRWMAALICSVVMPEKQRLRRLAYLVVLIEAPCLLNAVILLCFASIKGALFRRLLLFRP